MKTVLCIAGPTASGKSQWAVHVAKMVGGEIINADSMQVYSDLHVLSARPTLEEMDGVPHHLFGHIDGNELYSVGIWLRESVSIILDCLARDITPILVGGTGLYFKALTEGLAHIPEPANEAKLYARNLLDIGIEALRKEADRLDPKATARVLGDDPQRLLRIVSVARGTDYPMSHWQKNTRPIIPKGYWDGTLLLPDRSWLYKRINRRFDMMTTNGGLEEVKRLKARHLSADQPVMKAIGVRPFLDYLEGNISYEAAVSDAKRDTRRLAKRQYTWFRAPPEGWTPLVLMTKS